MNIGLNMNIGLKIHLKTKIMKTTRQYLRVCFDCRGSRMISDPFPMSTSSSLGCPACHGIGTIIVTEVIDTEIIKDKNYEDKRKTNYNYFRKMRKR